MTKKTRTGSSVVVAILLLFAQWTVPGYGKRNEKNQGTAYALIAGTTFRTSGFALPGSKVRLERRSSESGGVRLKALESVTDNRGEFALRTPVVPVEWTVRVQADGYQPQSRIVHINGEQRVELSFVPEPVQARPNRGEGK